MDALSCKDRFNQMSGFLLDYLEALPQVQDVTFVSGTPLQDDELEQWDEVMLIYL